MNFNQIKTLQHNLRNISDDTIEIQLKRDSYLDESSKFVLSISESIYQTKEINTILLTGATGHLGCHILYQLLLNTNYNIIILIRALDDEDATQRIQEKFKYYFSHDLVRYNERIRIIPADIGLFDLGISRDCYQELQSSVDSVIHCAASVKFFDDYENLYLANVLITRNLLKFTAKTQLKDFHFISTLGIFMDGTIPGLNYHEFTEDDSGGLLQDRHHIYCETKYLGEQEVIKASNYGVKANIYRVGNLVANSLTLTHQKNLDDNAFFHLLKTYILLKQIPGELSIIEASPVDYTALAIVKLFDKRSLVNQTFHISNPVLYNVTKYLNTYNPESVKQVGIDEFLDTLASRFGEELNCVNSILYRFCLLQNWLGHINTDNITKYKIVNDRTNLILSTLGFDWKKIDENKIINFLAIDLAYKAVNNVLSNEKTLESLILISDLVPVPYYWLSTDKKFIGINEAGLKAIGANNKSQVLGKSLFELYGDVVIANKLEQSIDQIIESKQIQECEDRIIDVSTKKYRYYHAIRKPVFNEYGDLIAVVGTSFETTAQRELEKLKNEFSVQVKIIEKQRKYRDFLTKLVNLLKTEISGFLSDEDSALNEKDVGGIDELPIELNKLQQSILYLISHGKSYSEISSYIESKMNLELSSQSISSIINSQLYQKFDVNNTNDLLFKAYKYNLIPLYLE